MRILINSEPLDYQLEDETRLGEVVDELEQWLRSGQFAIVALNVNDSTYPIHARDAWKDIPVDEVAAMDVEALPLARVDETTLAALAEYLGMLSDALNPAVDALRSADAVRELAAELPHVRRRIGGFFPALVDENGETAVLRDASLDAGVAPGGDACVVLRKEIDDLLELLSSRAREYTHPARELAITLGRLSSIAAQAVEVPLQMHGGNEGQAMQTLITLTELFGRVLRIVPILEREPTDERDPTGEIDVEAVKRFASELSPQLVELKEALEIRDTVLVGDLLEYEIAPKLERLAEIIPDIQETS